MTIQRKRPATILAFLLAGGEGTRLRPLTADRAKPAVRFAGDYRIIDFALSSLVNSRVAPIYVLAQYKPGTLLAHLGSEWCPHWPVRVRLPATGQSFCGTADAVYRNLELVERHGPDVVAVFAADHVFRMDVRQMARFHAARDADVTVACVPVPVEKASSFGIMAVGADGVIEEFQEKPAVPRALSGDPRLACASMGNYLFKPRSLKALLEQAIGRGGSDFGRHILPMLPGSRYRAFAYDFAANEVPGVDNAEERAYWRDVGTLEALEAARRDVAGSRPRFNLHHPAWPMRPNAAGAALARHAGSAAPALGAFLRGKETYAENESRDLRPA